MYMVWYNLPPHFVKFINQKTLETHAIIEEKKYINYSLLAHKISKNLYQSLSIDTARKGIIGITFSIVFNTFEQV